MSGVLYSAMKSNSVVKGEEGEGSTLPTFDIGSKLAELKQTRKLGTKITMKVWLDIENILFSILFEYPIK